MHPRLLSCVGTAFLLVALVLMAGRKQQQTDTRMHTRKILQAPVTPAKEVQAQQAARFCSTSPEVKAGKCGWATPQEIDATANKICNLCGTIWLGEVKQLPNTFVGAYRSYGSLAPRFVSLACKPGRLLVRAVFKVLNSTNTDKDSCTRLETQSSVLGSLGKNPSPIRRCELVLPQHANTANAEVAAALKSTEVNCKSCRSCKDCPWHELGRWYSDTATFDWGGCKAVAQPGAEYTPAKPSMVVNPGPTWILAKFEVQEAS